MNLFIYFLFACFVIIDAKIYDVNSSDPIDLVMPCHPKDLETLDLCIDGALKNIKGIRRVIVVSETKLTDKAEWFPEELYPFNKYTIAFEIFGNQEEAQKYIENPKNRAGWILKQLLVLYHTRVIPGLSSNVLFIDCDTIFMKPVTFFDNDGCALYNPGYEISKFYFDHGARVIPGFKKVFRNYSGISHHMLFQKSILEDMLNVIELNGKDEAWKVLCRAIDKKCMYRSPLSEYELYFNFAFANTNQVKLRSLVWQNSPDFCRLDHFHRINKYDYMSFHHYVRNKKKVAKKLSQKTQLKFNNKNNKKRAK